jgi:hypothetical protein
MTRDPIRRSAAARRSRQVNRYASLRSGTVALTGIAVLVGPLRRRVGKALGLPRFAHHDHTPANDELVAKQICARLDPVTDALHLLPVQVTVANHVATLHGDVHQLSEAGVIEEAAASSRGIEGVVSHLQAASKRNGSQRHCVSCLRRHEPEGARPQPTTQRCARSLPSSSNTFRWLIGPGSWSTFPQTSGASPGHRVDAESPSRCWPTTSTPLSIQ